MARALRIADLYVEHVFTDAIQTEPIDDVVVVTGLQHFVQLAVAPHRTVVITTVFLIRIARSGPSTASE